MATRCYDLERRDTSLLVKADMEEHIEEALRQSCLLSIPSKQPPERGERGAYPPVGCVFPCY